MDESGARRYMFSTRRSRHGVPDSFKFIQRRTHHRVPEPDRGPRSDRDNRTDYRTGDTTAQLPNWYYYGAITATILATLIFIMLRSQ